MSGIKLQTFGLLARRLDGKPTTPGASNLTWQRATTLAESQLASRTCKIQNKLSASLSKLRRKFCNIYIYYLQMWPLAASYNLVGHRLELIKHVTSAVSFHIIILFGAMFIYNLFLKMNMTFET